MEAISFSPLKPSCPFVRAVVICVLQVASVDVGDGGRGRPFKNVINRNILVGFHVYSYWWIVRERESE